VGGSGSQAARGCGYLDPEDSDGELEVSGGPRWEHESEIQAERETEREGMVEEEGQQRDRGMCLT
jgi:hypothetical protein